MTKKMENRRERRRPLAVFVCAICLLALCLMQTTNRAYAHEGVAVGPYHVVVGWVVEPAIVGERNAVFIEITEDEQPVTGAESALDVELIYGAETFRANLSAAPVPGQYTVDVFPTVRGQYEVRLFGELGDTAVDVTIEPEEVFSGDRIQFPEPLPDAREMQAQIRALETNLQSARTISYAAVGVAALALALALVSLFRKR
jgi:hypothetical protein